MRHLVVLAPLLVGCFAHTHVDTNAPGVVHVSEPPKDLTDPNPERPADPGERGFILQESLVLHGVGVQSVGKAPATFLPFDLELAPSFFTLRESHRNLVAPHALDGVVRPNVGVQLRVFPKTDTRATFGPVWLEAQWVGFDQDHFWGGSLGAGLVTTFARVGPQATACAGPYVLLALCARGSWMKDEGTTLQFYLQYTGFAEWVWSR